MTHTDDGIPLGIIFAVDQIRKARQALYDQVKEHPVLTALWLRQEALYDDACSALRFIYQEPFGSYTASEIASIRQQAKAANAHMRKVMDEQGITPDPATKHD